MEPEKNLFEKVSTWITNSVTLKLAVIAVLILILLIPSVMIQEIIYERELLKNEAITEVSAKWARNQLINGPVLTVPLIYEYEKDGKIETTTRNWHLLPENLSIEAEVEPEKLRRGIYEIVVYRSGIDISGNFNMKIKPDPTHLKQIRFDQAYLTIGISDLRGIKNQINVKWDKEILSVKPGSRLFNLIYSGVSVDLPDLEVFMGKTVDFEFALDLQGSQNLSFIPVGSTTDVLIKSVWEYPSFNGNFLPDNRVIDSEGFEASWNILQLNRNIPESWIDNELSQNMEEAAFGVDLLLSMDDYQKSMRSAKYAILTIALTFLIFFLVEVLNKRKIHPFQYTLVGLALCLFYVLLVSISEHSNFNLAYGISTLGIVCMVSLYSLSVFNARRLTLVLVSTLLAIYGFLYVTLQLTEYALLMGSIGLTLILGATMYFTRNIDWYNLNTSSE